MKKALLILTMAGLLFNFSCSKDDDGTETGISPEAKVTAETFVLGTWRMTNVTFKGEPFDQQCLDEEIIVFKEDNSASYSFTEIHFDEVSETCQAGDVGSGSFKWVVSDENKITVFETDEDGEKHELDLFIEDNSFVFNFTVIDELSDTVEVYRHTYERQNTK